jgi:CHRD domain-containing protein
MEENLMRTFRTVSLVVGLSLLTIVGPLGISRAGSSTLDERRSFRTTLKSFNEVPSLSTNGSGQFTARISNNDDSIQFVLTYQDLTGNPLVAHIHFAQKGVSGGVSVFLCGGSTPACPAQPGRVTGTITAADVIGPTGQGIAAGEFAELLRAIRGGVTYVNVHTPTFPGGEIRGQLQGAEDDN